jgi:type VI secretion system protein ImpE
MSQPAIPADAPLAQQVAAAMAAVRATPQAPAARLALVQLDCICGNWTRAQAQLGVLRQLDAEADRFVRLYQGLIAAETEREAVFAARSRPVSLGAPAAWMAMLVKALEHDAGGAARAATELRRRAAEAAPNRPGCIDGTGFTWIQDADQRLGPVLEVVVNGQYRWLPFTHLARLTAHPPAAPHDLVWQPVQLSLAGAPDIGAFVPVRYPGSATHPDDAIRLARATDWTGADDAQIGHGQRLLAIDTDDRPFLDIRKLTLAPDGEAADA